MTRGRATSFLGAGRKYRVPQAASRQQALAMIEAEPIDWCFATAHAAVDRKSARVGDLERRETHPLLPVIVITGDERREPALRRAAGRLPTFP